MTVTWIKGEKYADSLLVTYVTLWSRSQLADGHCIQFT